MCCKESLKKGLCGTHYMRLYRHGRLHVIFPELKLSDKEGIRNWLMSHREIKENGCWIWTGSGEVYGKIGIEDKYYLVHRLSAMIYNGFNIFSPLLICHSCDTPRCFNPTHLFAGTIQDNNRDRHLKKRDRGAVGENHPRAVLDCDRVNLIRQLAGEKSYGELGIMFGVSKITIRDVIKRRSWKHI